MDINGIHNLSESKNSENINKTSLKKSKNISEENKDAIDNVVISDEAKTAFQERNLLVKVNELQDIRNDLIEKVHAELSKDTLLSPQNLENTADIILKGIEDESL